MTRPTYETDADLEAETAVAEIVGSRFGCQMLRMRRYARVDWLAERNNRCWFVAEIKCHTTNPTRETFILSAEKWATLRLVAHALRVRPYVFVRFADGSVRYVDLSVAVPVRLEMNGRTDRNDPDDWEPCVFIPIAQTIALPE